MPRTPPAKWHIQEFAKLASMIDFLKEKYRPYTAIAREAVRRGIIDKKEVNRFYRVFSIVVNNIGIFEGQFFSSDQTPTRRNRWEWKLPDDMTKDQFLKKLKDYVSEHFKKPLWS